MNAPANCVSPENVREWVTDARRLIETIAASRQPIPQHLQQPYAQACRVVEQVEAATVPDDGLGFFPLLWPLVTVAGLAAGGFGLYKAGVVLDQVGSAVADALSGTVKETGKALAYGSYAVVALLVFNFAKRGRFRPVAA